MGGFDSKVKSLQPDLDFTCVAAEKKVYEPSPIRQSRVTRHWLTFYGPESGFARLIHMPATLLPPARVVSFSLNIVRRIFELGIDRGCQILFNGKILTEDEGMKWKLGKNRIDSFYGYFFWNIISKNLVNLLISRINTISQLWNAINV